MILNDDALLVSLIEELIKKHKCYSVILYGSRARGDATNSSDYDLMGVRKSGKSYRVAEKRNGTYLDIFIYPEKALERVDDSFLYMNGGMVLYEKEKFGTTFLKKLKLISKKKYKPLSSNEIEVRKVWLHKMFDRISVGDIEGNYRRSWLHESLLIEYFNIRRKRYLGSKQSFEYLKKNDPKIFTLFEKVLQNPLDFVVLKRLVEKVSTIKLS